MIFSGMPLYFSFCFNLTTEGHCMDKVEKKFQKELTDELKSKYPGCVVLKNDSAYIQGIPDWTILYKDRWATLEAKRNKDAKHQPNQDYYVGQLNEMSFSSFIYPENKEEVLEQLDKLFNS